MADFYIVTGGASSNKVLIGMALAVKYKIPLLFGESFYTWGAFRSACREEHWGSDWPYRYWARFMDETLASTGSCVLVCQHLEGSEIQEWQEFGRVFIIEADPTAEEMMAQWTAEQNAMKRTGMAKRASFNTLATLEQDIVAFEISRETARLAAEAAALASAEYRNSPEGIEERRLRNEELNKRIGDRQKSV